MRKFIFVLLTLLLVSPFSFAMKGIIWQPQNRDSQVTDTQWQGLMSQLRLQGFDTLVLQWTRYGDAFTQPEQSATGWPEADCRAERRSGIFYAPETVVRSAGKLS